MSGISVNEVPEGQSEFPRVRRVFIGEMPYVRCREQSLKDCDRPMLADAPHCGIETHTRVAPVGEPRGEPLFRKRGLRRPVLIVDEEYELLEESAGEPKQFDPEIFDPAAVWVSTQVQRDFTAYHGVDAEAAISNVRTLLQLAAANGAHCQLSSGAHSFWWRGYTARVTPDLQVVVRYRTSHYERTPQMLAEGVPSKMSRRARNRQPRKEIPAAEVNLAVGEVRQGVVGNVVMFGAFVDIGGFDGLLHKSEFGVEIEDPRAHFATGDEVSVEVISVDSVNGRVGLRLLGELPRREEA